MTYDKWLHLKDDLRYLQAAIRDVERTPDLPEFIQECLSSAMLEIRGAQIGLETNYAWTDDKQPA